MDVRDRLRARQTALLESLTRQAPVPPDFDTTRVGLTAEGLARKRQHETGHFLRRLQLPLEELFPRFAQEVPRASTPRLDGYRFCGWLLEHELAGSAWRAVRGLRLSWCERDGDAWPARWPRLHLSRRGCALYWPGRGVRWL